MSKIPFDESEMKISGYTPNFFTPPGDPGVPYAACRIYEVLPQSYGGTLNGSYSRRRFTE